MIAACPLQSISNGEKVNEPLYLVFSGILTFYRAFQAKDSMKNTSAITAVTKSSMKP